MIPNFLSPLQVFLQPEKQHARPPPLTPPYCDDPQPSLPSHKETLSKNQHDSILPPKLNFTIPSTLPLKSADVHRTNHCLWALSPYSEPNQLCHALAWRADLDGFGH